MTDVDLTAAVEAATKALYDDERTWDEFYEDVKRNGKPRTIRKLVAEIAVEAAAPVLLADLREQIARELLRAAEALPYGELRGYAEWYAAIARGSQPPAERSES